MKKVIYSAIAVSLLATVPVAYADGLYVQADVGLSNLNYTPDGSKIKLGRGIPRLKESYKDSGLMPRVSAGYDMGAYRVAVDYTSHKAVKGDSEFSEDGVKVGVKAEVKASSIGVSGIYDFDSGSAIKPYVGVRLGYNAVKTSVDVAVTENATTEKGFAKDTDKKFGVGVMGGVNYKISNNLTADVGYRYNRFYADLKAHEVSAGLRYSF